MLPAVLFGPFEDLLLSFLSRHTHSNGLTTPSGSLFCVYAIIYTLEFRVAAVPRHRSGTDYQAVPSAEGTRAGAEKSA